MAKQKYLEGKTFLFTGTLTEMTRKETETAVKENGGTVLSGVSPKLNYLVAGEDAGSKLAKAKKENTVKIITEKDFLKMIKGNKKTAKDNLISKKPDKKIKKESNTKKGKTKTKPAKIDLEQNVTSTKEENIQFKFYTVTTEITTEELTSTEDLREIISLLEEESESNYIDILSERMAENDNHRVFINPTDFFIDVISGQTGKTLLEGLRYNSVTTETDNISLEIMIKEKFKRPLTKNKNTVFLVMENLFKGLYTGGEDRVSDKEVCCIDPKDIKVIISDGELCEISYKDNSFDTSEYQSKWMNMHGKGGDINLYVFKNKKKIKEVSLYFSPSEFLETLKNIQKNLIRTK